MADDGRTYIRVHDGMPDHPKVEALSDRGFRLLVEAWCWCSRHLTDGRIPLASWTKRGTHAARRELVTAGLVEDLGSEGVQMHDYLEHQRSRSEVEEIVMTRRASRTAASVKGNHRRWHVGPDGKPSDDCPLCQSDPKTDPNGTPGGIPSGTPNGTPSGSHIGIGIGTDIGTVVPEETLGGGVPDSTTHERPPAPNLDPNNPRCADHAGIPATNRGPNCHACAAVRASLDHQAAAAIDGEKAVRAAWRKAVEACDDCDENGKIELPDGSLARHHDPVSAS